MNFKQWRKHMYAQTLSVLCAVKPRKDLQSSTERQSNVVEYLTAVVVVCQ